MSIEEKQGQADAVTFEKVLESELKIITKQRALADTPKKEMQLAGLAFSGGGIRSAVFNLGFIQGLANRNSLHVFDYLSTVSGGGYIGGWLSALLHRDANKNITDEDEKRIVAGEKEMQKLQETILKPLPPSSDKKNPVDFSPSEDKSVRFLRRYSNYLTPRLGLSGDTLALISLMVRNVAVMQMILVSMLVAGFAGLLILGGEIWVSSDKDLLRPALTLLIIALIGALWTQFSWGWREKEGKSPNLFISFGVLLPALTAGIFMAVALKTASNNPPVSSNNTWFLLVAGYCIIWLPTCFITIEKPIVRRVANFGIALLGIIGGATVLFIELHFGLGVFYDLLIKAPFGHAVAFAPPITIALFSLVITVHLALAGSAISEQSREWWARLGGQGMFLALAWTLAFIFLLYVPPLMQYGWDNAVHWVIAGGGLSVILTAVGTIFAKGSDTNGKNSVIWKDIIAKIAPWIFIILLLGLVSFSFVHNILGVNFPSKIPATSTPSYQANLACTEAGKICNITLAQTPDVTPAKTIETYQKNLLHVLAEPINIEILNNPNKLVFIFFASGSLFLFLLFFVDLNLFSAHSFYRNRLARAFLGASRKKRKPNPYTGFDIKDDLSLADLAGQRPIHLLNATLNMTGGEDLAWQTRRGACFTFTPQYAGFATRDSNSEMIGGFCPTSGYGDDLSLATVVATCGAAASPNMGFHTSTSVAALLTAFNLRLARWCPNPTENEWKRRNPIPSAAPLFSELFGNTTGDNAWVNLSDGGHFENLGIYELIRRRVALIVVTDVGADPTFQFDDLAMAVRKIWVDFGVRVEIDEADLDKIRPKGQKDDKDECKDVPRFSEKYWALGRICYPDCAPGYLVYVKSAIAGDVPIDIRQYRDAHPAFPHEPTTDQWFDEDQFEAYRHLGQIIAEKLLDDLPIKINKGESGSSIIKKLYEKTQKHFQHTTW